MPAPIRINLTSEEDQQLQEISLAEGIPRRSKLRAMAVRLNADGWTVPKIARHLHQNEHTIRSTIRRWQAQGREGLWEAPRPGRQPRWQAADLQAVETWLAQPRSYTSRQLCQKLASERGVLLSQRQMSRLLQKRGTVGNDCATVLHRPKTQTTFGSNGRIGRCSSSGQTKD